MSEPDRDRPQGQLFEEAAAWFARMRGPDAEASRDEFEAWLARGALHRSAYNRAADPGGKPERRIAHAKTRRDR